MNSWPRQPVPVVRGCVFCREGLHTSCRYGFDGVDGGQGEAARVPQADGTLVALPVERDDALMPSLLTLSDVMATGHHAALSARVAPGNTVAVVGDGAGGLGAESVLECVGLGESTVTALRCVRAGGAVGRVGVPQEDTVPEAMSTFMANVTIAGGPAAARAYIEELLPDVLERKIEPGRVFDHTTGIDGVRTVTAR